VPNTIAIRRRISSVRNTRQITKAMELVSASKMRRAQDRARLSRAYQTAAYDLLARLSTIKEAETHPLFEKRQVKSKLYIVITSNSGLAGAYNYNVLKLLTSAAMADRDTRIETHHNLSENLQAVHSTSVKSHVITIGKQGANFARRLEHINLLAVYPAFGDEPTANDIRPILNTIVDQYRDKSVDEVQIIYTKFVSNLSQQATALNLLPAEVENESELATFTNFEPSVDEVLDSATTRLIEVQIWQALLESLASEHSMRMLAMKNATDNANDIIGDLTLEFNTARQAAITQELAEITGGADAIQQ
jgi:F-type H+-transporting ATPase subunit gamma